MSIRLIQAVLEHERAPSDPGRRFVLLLLAYFANDDGTEARPGLELLSRRAAMPARTVQHHLTELHRAGWVVRDRHSRPGQATVWRVLRSPQHTQPVAPVRGGTHAKSSSNTRKIQQEHTQAHGSPPVKTRQDPSQPPLPPQRAAEVVHAELLPAPASDGAGGELATGRYLDELIAAVRDQRTPTLTRQQARDARARARDALEAGWNPDLVVAALVAASAFTPAAFTFAVDQIRRQMVGDRKSGLTKFEQSEGRP